MILPLRIHAIVVQVSQETGIPVDQMMSRTRTNKLARARWEAWRRIRALDNPPSFPCIGRWFNRDHTTIIHGVYHD